MTSTWEMVHRHLWASLHLGRLNGASRSLASVLGQSAVGSDTGALSPGNSCGRAIVETQCESKSVLSISGRFVRDSKPADIRAFFLRWIDALGRKGRVFVMIGDVSAGTPPVNVFTAVAAVHTHGRYPIAADLSQVEVKLPAFLSLRGVAAWPAGGGSHPQSKGDAVRAVRSSFIPAAYKRGSSTWLFL